jgi:hypothetical protein
MDPAIVVAAVAMIRPSVSDAVINLIMLVHLLTTFLLKLHLSPALLPIAARCRILDLEPMR